VFPVDSLEELIEEGGAFGLPCEVPELVQTI